MADFLEAVKHKDPGKISCTVQDAFASSTTVQLAMVAYYTDSLVKWDDQSKTIINNPQAAALLTRKYREGWQHPMQAELQQKNAIVKPQ